MFHHGKKISQNLSGMKFIGKTIPYRNSCILSQFFNNMLTESTIFNAIIHPAKNPGGIFHGFLLTDL